VTPRIVRIALAAAGALLVAGAVVAATAYAAGVPLQPFAASSPSPKPSASPSQRQEACTDFMGHLASDLGKSQSDVNAAAQKALGQTIDDAVKNGQLTQSQGDRLKQRVAGQTLCSGALGALSRPGGLGAPDRQILLDDAAKALGMTPSDLMSQLKSGKSLQDIATAKGMTEQQFRTAFVADVKADLDAQVKAGKLTQAQEDEILNRLQNGPLPFWSKAPRSGGRRPSPTPTP
jgi:hypothetical protein